jgi:hypothetical protein
MLPETLFAKPNFSMLRGNSAEACIFSEFHPQPSSFGKHSFMAKLYKYLALAKPALPGQFDLLVSSQSKENGQKKLFVPMSSPKKVVISEQHENILLFLSSTNFYYLFLSLPKIG